MRRQSAKSGVDYGQAGRQAYPIESSNLFPGRRALSVHADERHRGQQHEKQNTELTATLDTSRYEAGRLLADAKAQLESREYAKARESLSALLANQPGSAEAEEGRTMLAVITTAEDKANAKWDKASAAIQKKWASARAAELRAESDKERADLEAGLAEKISQEWEKAKEQVRADWENAG